MILANKKVITRALGQGNPSETIANEFVHCLIATPAKKQQAEVLNMSDVPNQKVSVPLSFWNEHKAELLAREHEVAVQIGAADCAEDIKDDLADIKTIVLPFESFVDGRSYSHAYLLRTRYNFEGEIRAVGDVHYDLVNFLARCGVDAFELREGDDIEAAREAFELYSETYQPSADGGNLIFARRRAVH